MSASAATFPRCWAVRGVPRQFAFCAAARQYPSAFPGTIAAVEERVPLAERRQLVARQRFIWPSIWKDPVFGRLPGDEQVLFIGLFSIADDEGRLMADPAYLRAELYPYKDFTTKRVTALRDRVVEKCAHVHLYEIGGQAYIQLRKWSDYQKPKYPKPSRIPPPSFPESSPNVSPQGRDGLDRDGLDWVGKEPVAVDVVPLQANSVRASLGLTAASPDIVDFLQEGAA